MLSNVETYYFYMDEQKIGDIRYLTYEKDLDGIFQAVEKALNGYPSISKLKDSLYNYYISECNDYAESDPEYEKEFAISKFIVMMNRVISLELLFIQFPRSDDYKEYEKELELFILLCNHEINSNNNMLRRQQILNPVETYKKMYENYLATFVNVPEELYQSNVLFMKKNGNKHYF